MTQLYAVRDRLIDYFMKPFAAPNDKEVLASLAVAINQGEGNSALEQTPHHFEIWRLGSVTETGDLRPGKELLATCDSLVRGSIRRGSESGAPKPPIAPDAITRPDSGVNGNAHSDTGPLPIAPHRQAHEAQ